MSLLLPEMTRSRPAIPGLIAGDGVGRNNLRGRRRDLRGDFQRIRCRTTRGAIRCRINIHAGAIAPHARHGRIAEQAPVRSSPEDGQVAAGAGAPLRVSRVSTQVRLASGPASAAGGSGIEKTESQAWLKQPVFHRSGSGNTRRAPWPSSWPAQSLPVCRSATIRR